MTEECERVTILQELLQADFHRALASLGPEETSRMLRRVFGAFLSLTSDTNSPSSTQNPASPSSSEPSSITSSTIQNTSTLALLETHTRQLLASVGLDYHG